MKDIIKAWIHKKLDRSKIDYNYQGRYVIRIDDIGIAILDLMDFKIETFDIHSNLDEVIEFICNHPQEFINITIKNGQIDYNLGRLAFKSKYGCVYMKSPSELILEDARGKHYLRWIRDGVWYRILYDDYVLYTIRLQDSKYLMFYISDIQDLMDITIAIKDTKVIFDNELISIKATGIEKVKINNIRHIANIVENNLAYTLIDMYSKELIDGSIIIDYYLNAINNLEKYKNDILILNKNCIDILGRDRVAKVTKKLFLQEG